VEGFFGGEGTEGGQFSSAAEGPGGVAVNQSGTGGAAAGDVYVVDGGNNRVQQFSATGAFKRAIGLDVGGSGVNVCTVAASCAAGTESGAAGGMSSPQGIAIEQSTGNLYVTDQGNRRVDVFSAEGAFEGAFGWNVDATTPEEELQLCTEATGCQAGSEGAGEGQLGFEVGYPAISPLNGHVLIADKANHRVQELAPAITAGSISGISFVRAFGEFGEGLEGKVGQFGNQSPSQVAVDSNGSVYTLDRGNSRIQRFDSTGSNPELFAYTQVHGQFGGEEPNAIAVDSSNNHVLVLKPCGKTLCPESTSETRVLELSEAGVLLETHAEGDGGVGASGVASKQGGGRIYTTSNNGPAVSGGGGPDVLILGNTPPLPPTVTIEAVTTFTAHTATFVGNVNPGNWPTGYHFEYSPDGSHWTKLPSGGDAFVGSDSTSHEVSQEASGLTGHTTYQVRLVATKHNTTSRAIAETSFTTAAAPPVIKAIQVFPGATSAKLRAEINPEGQQTEYAFEYVSQAQFEASGFANAETATGTVSGGSLASVEAKIEGLSSGTAYRFRLTATNPAGAETSPDVAFSTYLPPAVGLPDGRAYEQASSVDKNGQDIRADELTVQASEDGSRITFFASSGLDEGESAQWIPSFMASRSSAPAAWSTQSILPSVSTGQFGRVKGWGEDLSATFSVNKDKVVGGKFTFYLRESGGHLVPIVAEMANGEVLFAAASQGSREVYFETKNRLLPAAPAGKTNAYIWDRETGELKLVGVLNSGAVASATGTIAGPYAWFTENTTAGGMERNYYTQPFHALSRDGSIAFFTSAGADQLYARLNPTAEQSPLNGSEECADPTLACTVKVSASQRTVPDPNGEKPAAFVSATPDGSKAFFMSSSALTDDANTGPSDEGNDLYRYDTGSGQMVDIAPDASDENGAEVRGVLGTSENGSYVYFVANGVLAPGATAGDCGFGEAFQGSCNLYLWHEGAVTFISRLQARAEGGEASDMSNWAPTSTWDGTHMQRTARVSSDGKTLLFRSSGRHTSYENEGLSELYRYRAGGPGLACVSCNPTGAPPVGGISLSSAERLFGPGGMLVLTRNLSSDGNRVFFETLDKLNAADTNGDAGCPILNPRKFGPETRACRDVYEWEAKGTGSCESESEDSGCLYLISAGTREEPSYFLDASTSGDNAFILTRDRLVGQDEDDLEDIYDARIGGGIASQNPEKRSPCEGEACKGAATPPPSTSSAGTALFSGPGNQKSQAKKPKKHRKRHAHHHAKRSKHASKRQARTYR
jgi:hypothetical protein